VAPPRSRAAIKSVSCQRRIGAGKITCSIRVPLKKAPDTHEDERRLREEKKKRVPEHERGQHATNSKERKTQKNVMTYRTTPSKRQRMWWGGPTYENKGITGGRLSLERGKNPAKGTTVNTGKKLGEEEGG